jgi:hypothetical protein
VASQEGLSSRNEWGLTNILASHSKEISEIPNGYERLKKDPVQLNKPVNIIITDLRCYLKRK